VPDDHRPQFHLTPPANWMNDPNGLCVVDGRLHAFYQHNPDAPRWEHMSWGHAVTDDLVTWEHLPVAIRPDPDGPDAFGCWTGCVIVDDDRAATMLYTGVTLDGDVRRASICRATTSDGLLTWTKDATNPCIAGPPPGIEQDAFRDPFVWRDGESWAMLVGAGRTDGLGAVLLYRSPDLRTWAYVGPFLAGDEVDRAAGADGPCWECPQLLRFGDAAILIVSIVDRTPGVRPSHVAAFVGHIDGDRFVVDRVDELGMGPDFYAPATVALPDERHLVFGWIPEDPPHEESTRSWAGSLTFPRVVSLDARGETILTLAPEVLALRTTPVRRRTRELLGDAHPSHLPIAGGHVEIEMEIDPGDAEEVAIELIDEADDGPEVRIAFRPQTRSISLARRGIVGVAGRSSQGGAELDPWSPPLRLRVLIDGSVLEIEADGRTMGTARLTATHGDRRALTFAATGGTARIANLRTWSLTAPGSRRGAVG